MKKLNINELIWFIILSSFAYYIYKLFNTGKIYLYIHPRMFKYVYFSYVVFVILSISQIRSIFTPIKTNKIKIGYIVFIVPLFLAFVVNPNNLSGKVVSNKGVNLGNTSLKNIEKTITNEKEETLQSEIISDNDTNTDMYDDTDTNNNMDSDIYSESDDVDYYHNPDGVKFFEILVDTNEDLDRMLGEEVELIGFVFRDSDFTETRFVVSRLLITCCAADAQVVGLLCEWNESSKLEDDEWIKVSGIIESTTLYNEYLERDEILPLIKVTKLERIETCEDPYIYPYYN